MKKTFVFYSLLVFLLGCNNKNPNSDVPQSFNSIHFSNINYNSEMDSSPYQETYFLPLETNKDNLLGDVKIIKTYDDHIFVSDNKMIAKFTFNEESKQGKAGKVLNRIGRGPGEYLKIVDFAVDDESLFIFDGFKVNIYNNKSLKFTKSIKPKFNAIQMEKQNNHLIFYTLHLQNREEYDYEIITLNITNQDEKKYFRNSKNTFGSPSIGNQINKVNKVLFYCSPFRNVTYKFNKNTEPEVFAIWNYKNDKILNLNESMHSVNQMEKSDVCYNFNEAMVINNFLYIQFCYKAIYKCLWYNTYNQKYFVSSASFMPQTNYKSFLISTFPSWEIAEILKNNFKDDNEVRKMYSKVLNVNEDDNPCLLVRKIRD